MSLTKVNEDVFDRIGVGQTSLSCPEEDLLRSIGVDQRRTLRLSKEMIQGHVWQKWIIG